MRVIRKIIVHASGYSGDTLRSIAARHRCRGLMRIGFHYVVREDGQIERGRPLEDAGAHCLGYNADSVGICLCGESLPTEAQMRKLRGLVRRLEKRFPRAEVCRVAELDPWIRDALPRDLNLTEKETGA